MRVLISTLQYNILALKKLAVETPQKSVQWGNKVRCRWLFKTWDSNIPIMAPNDIRNQVTKMTYKMNALCRFTASSKDHDVPDSKHGLGCAHSEKLSSERTKKQHVFLLSQNSFNMFHEASVIMKNF